jgi:Na+-driven multidrug efflux pump
MNIMVFGALSNVALDALYIYGFGRGIQGAAWATVIAMSLASVFVLQHFFREDSIIRFRKEYYKPNGSIMISIFAIGMSPFAMQLAGSLVNVVMNHALKTLGGDLAIGANVFISSVGLLLVMLIMGITQGMQPIVGFNYGAGNQERVRHTFRLVLIAATVITSFGCICSLLFPEWIVRAFTNDGELVAISTNGLKISLSVFFVVGSQIVISQFFQSIGFAWKAMFLSLSRQCLFLIPSILFFPEFFGLDGVWLAAPFSDLIAAFTAWIFFWYHVKQVNKQA